MLALPTLVAAGAAPAAPGPYPWRNDSANLALTAAWNDFLAATPFSADTPSPDVVDTPPVSLRWSLGSDMPWAQKDGVGCWLTDVGEFVVTGGLWINVTGRTDQQG